MTSSQGDDFSENRNLQSFFITKIWPEQECMDKQTGRWTGMLEWGGGVGGGREGI